ncbi:hypothetical protein EFK50_18765 [Nocardioides marmoriginsengisoli]|uniref:Uncharacterized protein n=1 Tax=Nocardioides marmoriginsengisoli TaxID=661483 RepID=A0A3N0CA90_9ACTN|nr:hypothetical protein EFK50_18765 [Nocardioides marmoriginsengisoli]
MTITTVLVSVKAPAEFGPGKYTLPVDGQLAKSRLDDLRVERNVRTFRTDGTMVSATETVFEPSSLNPEQIFSSNVTSMRAVVEE